MRIVDRAAFLALPAGTVYSKYEPCIFGELHIKGDTWGNDFLCQQIADAIAAKSSNEFDMQLAEAQQAGASIPMDFDCLGRDGCFDGPVTWFAVWEPADVEMLIARLAVALVDVRAACD